MKSAHNVQYLASDAVWWQEDKYALQQQQKEALIRFKKFFSKKQTSNVRISDWTESQLE